MGRFIGKNTLVSPETDSITGTVGANRRYSACDAPIELV